MRVKVLLAVCCFLALSVSVEGQRRRGRLDPSRLSTATIAIFDTSATDPNADSPISTATYTNIPCGARLGTQNLTDPTLGFWSDPRQPADECVVNMSAQIAALASGSYKAAVKIGGEASYGSFSSTFSKT